MTDRALYDAVHEYLVAEIRLGALSSPKAGESIPDDWRAANRRFMSARSALITEHDRIAEEIADAEPAEE